MKHPDPTIIPWVFGILAVGWLVFVIIMFWCGHQRSRRWSEQTRRWQHESRVHQRVQELLAQEYEHLLTPEARQRREAQRHHLQELRAEAELTAEAARRGRT
jgi:flagellar biosynthesis/type III secretory pathway M-ring protein FliF/YscJ